MHLCFTVMDKLHSYPSSMSETGRSHKQDGVSVSLNTVPSLCGHGNRNTQLWKALQENSFCVAHYDAKLTGSRLKV